MRAVPLLQASEVPGAAVQAERSSGERNREAPLKQAWKSDGLSGALPEEASTPMD